MLFIAIKNVFLIADPISNINVFPLCGLNVQLYCKTLVHFKYRGLYSLRKLYSTFTNYITKNGTVRQMNLSFSVKLLYNVYQNITKKEEHSARAGFKVSLMKRRFSNINRGVC